jgi:phosphate/sulfate permease
MEHFLIVATVVAMALLVWDCVEVGRNDAANLINAVFGSRVLTREMAVALAGLAVLLGATFASPVMETARKGIFDPSLLTIETAVIVYVTVYIVDTVLLYTYSAFGMPVSTTASLVFELVGASIAVAGSLGIVHWDKVGDVISEIFMAILLTGIAGFLIQRMFRGAISDKHDDHLRVLLHGPWCAGLMLTWLSWFLLVKGLKALPVITLFREHTLDVYGVGPVILLMWAAYTLLIHLVLTATGERGTGLLFRITAIIGMLSLAFAFGQNDLANCASPGLSAFWLWRNADQGVAIATHVPIPMIALTGCGMLMVLGMGSKNAQRVTRAAVNTGSQYDHITLYAPMWCRKIAMWMLPRTRTGIEIAPPPTRDDRGKRVHFDPLRASVIMAVSASVIAFASGRGLPVSTTYVTFAAVVATGMADRTMTRGDADLKIGRTIWVVFSWFAAAFIAMFASGIVAFIILKAGILGLVIGLTANLAIRFLVKKRGDRHEITYHQEISRSIEEQEIAAGRIPPKPTQPPPPPQPPA